MSRALSRVALLFGWALVLWGTLLVAATAVHAFEEGLRPALLHLVPGSGSSAWAWGNLMAVALALLAWPTAVAILLQVRRGR